VSLRGFAGISGTLVDTRDQFKDLFDLYVPIALAVFAIVSAVVVFALIRFRRRGDGIPRQRSSAPLAEGLYVVALAGITALLVTMTFRTEARVDRIASRPGLTVQVTASKWKWRFFYPRWGVTQVSSGLAPATLVVPTGTTVRFELTSRDVIHSFFVPGLRFKRDAFPGRVTRFDLTFDRPRFSGTCAEFCGLHHADMRFAVEAMPPAGFLDWVKLRLREGGSRG
jgi:cytochrome c oxidase subunit II